MFEKVKFKTVGTLICENFNISREHLQIDSIVTHGRDRWEVHFSIGEKNDKYAYIQYFVFPAPCEIEIHEGSKNSYDFVSCNARLMGFFDYYDYCEEHGMVLPELPLE